MRTLKTKKQIKDFLSLLARRAVGASPAVMRDAGKIVSAVRRNGDRALLRYTMKFDGHDRLRIGLTEIRKHARLSEKAVRSALELSARRIRRFHERQKESSWSVSEKGATLGQIVRPLERVGVYVPGGKASYPSTVLMNVIPAQVAGVKEIAVAVPTPGGEINPHVTTALDMLGIREVYAMGGAQAVSAFAYGTETVRRVDKITGPGNVYVAAAKRIVFGDVDIDMIAGPSEILVIADGSANPAFVAADLLSQAEHDEMASSVLITDSPELAASAVAEVRSQMKTLGRRKTAKASLGKYGAVIVVRNIEEAAWIANAISPEHLEVMTKSPRRLLPLLKNAGAIFLGPWTPESLGDYSAGPNHTLPTGSTSRWASPLGVYDFIKRTSLLEFGREGFSRIAGAAAIIADAEGLDAHARSIAIRKNR